jgi:hypothetical protein
MLIKGVLVGALGLIGCLMLYAGAGGSIPYLKYEALEAYGLPVGTVALLAAVALAKFWPVETTTTYRVTETTGDGDSRKSIITEIEKRSRFDLPGGVEERDKDV